MSDSLRKHLETIGTFLEELAKFTRKTLPPGIKKTYIQFLAPLSPEEVPKAFKSWSFKSTKFPSVEELLECCGRSPKQRAERFWATLEVERDRIADEVCRKEGILVEVRTLSHASEFNSGLVRRDLKSRFVEAYKLEWLEWWSRGEISQGETVIDFRPKTEVPKPIAEEEKLTADQLAVLSSKIKSLAANLGDRPNRPKGITPEEEAEIMGEIDREPKPEPEPEEPQDDDIPF